MAEEENPYVTLPMSRQFLQMRLMPGSCFDDGERRDWE